MSGPFGHVLYIYKLFYSVRHSDDSDVVVPLDEDYDVKHNTRTEYPDQVSPDNGPMNLGREAKNLAWDVQIIKFPRLSLDNIELLVYMISLTQFRPCSVLVLVGKIIFQQKPPLRDPGR